MPVEEIKAIIKRPNNVLNELTSAETILNTQYDKPVFIIDELITSGLVLICGKPKVGKNWLMLRMCADIASGEKFLGKFAVKASKVAYFALEDNASRIQDRLLDMGIEINLSNILICNKLATLDDDGMAKFERLIQTSSDIKVWIIDTMQRVKPSDKRSNMTPYQEDYEFMNKLQAIAFENNIVIILIHHSKKSVSDDSIDQALGSTALTGASDIIIMLSHSNKNIKLEITGRDVERRTIIYAVDKETMKFSVIDDDGTIKKQQSDLQDKVLEFLTNNSSAAFSPAKISASIGKTTDGGKATVRRALRKLTKSGKVESTTPGEYCIKSKAYEKGCYSCYREGIPQDLSCLGAVTTHSNNPIGDVTDTDRSVTTITDPLDVLLQLEPQARSSVQP